MDLRNNMIRVGEILANPKARAIVEREFPGLLSNPMLGMAKRMPLKKILYHSRGIVPQEKMRRVLKQLEEV